MDGIILHILELAIIILHCETHYISPWQNNDKHLVPRLQLYVLIFNVGKYNIGMNIFGDPRSFPITMCTLSAFVLLS
jgi:hypothetical protein